MLDSGEDGTQRLAGCLKYEEVNKMLWLTIAFLVVALIAALLGFGGLAGAATDLAKLAFVVFLILFLVSLVFGRRWRA